MPVVRTPHAIKIWNKHGRQGLKCQPRSRKTRRRPDFGAFERFVYGHGRPKEGGDDKQGEEYNKWASAEQAGGFIAQRGTGQGDVPSLTCWAAVFDILLQH